MAEQILRLFEELLKRNPSNVIALIGKARVHYGRSQYAIALRLYQKALTARPDMRPDPRIGIGQCFWHLKMKTDARAAWERALELVSPLAPQATEDSRVATHEHLCQRTIGNVVPGRCLSRSRY